MTIHLPSAAGRPRTPRVPSLLVLLAAVGLVVGACGAGAALPDGESQDGGAGGMPAVTMAPAPAEQPASGSDDEAYRSATDEQSSVDGPLIVRTGQLTLEVADLEKALADAQQAVVAAGGYVAASQRLGTDETASASVTYRIPSDRWEPTLAALRKVGAKVLGEQTASDEVTAQVVDLGARLVNLRATEAAFQEIMKKATKIPDILEVQGQLTAVRQQIEQLTAQKQALEKQAALATLTVAFSLPPVVAVAQVQEGWDPAAEADRALATLVGFGQGVASATIWLAIVVLPLAIVLGLGLAVAWLVARRLRPRGAPPASPLPPTPPAPAETPAG
jgi:hypothetical protein